MLVWFNCGLLSIFLLPQLTDRARITSLSVILWLHIKQKSYVTTIRRRRDATDLLRVPHTKWCGPGNRAAHHRELGGFAAADRCCRQHDERCPYYIDAWQEKYLLYNERPYTAMHCTCDERWVDPQKNNQFLPDLYSSFIYQKIQTESAGKKPMRVETKPMIRPWETKMAKLNSLLITKYVQGRRLTHLS